jgi:HK97 family phage major capsid protein
MTLTALGILEQVELSEKAQRLSRGNAADRAEASILVQRAKLIGERGCSSDEARAKYAGALVESLTPPRIEIAEAKYEKAFFRYLNSRTSEGEKEIRDLITGSQSILYSAGPQGGYTIPLAHEPTVFESIFQTDNLLSEKVCDFTVEPSPTLQPKQLWGYDLSTITASLVAEAAQQGAGTFPNIGGRVLRANLIYKVSIAASVEAEDDIPNILDKFSRAFGIGFARKLGADAILGNGGTTQPQGLLTALPTPVYATGSGKITLADLNAIYFSVSAAYRAQPKAGFLVSDSVMQRLRASTDSSGRPLLSIEHERATLFSKPIFICPSLGVAGGSPLASSNLIWGDLSHFHIRCSRPTVSRIINSSTTDITSGRALYVARIRMDSALFDPSGGSAPPLVSVTITG